MEVEPVQEAVTLLLPDVTDPGDLHPELFLDQVADFSIGVMIRAGISQIPQAVVQVKIGTLLESVPCEPEDFPQIGLGILSGMIVGEAVDRKVHLPDGSVE